MPTYRLTLMIYTEAATPEEAAAEFYTATEEADISFDIVETAPTEDVQ